MLAFIRRLESLGFEKRFLRKYLQTTRQLQLLYCSYHSINRKIRLGMSMQL